MVSKEHILDEIRRTALSNGGKPLGSQAFQNQTGIRQSDWFGKYWSRWGDATTEAGFERNVFNQAYDDDFVLSKYVEFVRELGHLPVGAELRIKAREETSFPSHNVFYRVGKKGELVAKAAAYCARNAGWDDVEEICRQFLSTQKKKIDTKTTTQPELDGYVYLIKSGKHYKIGMTRDIHRRAREISIELPERSKTIHVIQTDDPAGIEAYWHNRFKNRRGNGEWFELSSADVKAFRRRKFM